MLTFWGKADPDTNAAFGWHPLAYHLLDVAATAIAILEVRPLALSRAGELLGIEPAAARSLLVALTSLHDLGKFAPAFQAKATPNGWTWPPALGTFDPARLPGTWHTEDGYALSGLATSSGARRTAGCFTCFPSGCRLIGMDCST